MKAKYLCVLLSICMVYIIPAQIQENSRYAVVTEDGLRVRAKSDLGAEILDSLGRGDRVQVLGQSKEKYPIENAVDYWYQIRTSGGLEGWSYGYYLRLIRKMEYDGIQVIFDEAVSQEIIAETVPPTRRFADAHAFPERIHFRFNGYQLDSAAEHTRRIVFFPLKGPTAIEGYERTTTKEMMDLLTEADLDLSHGVPTITYHSANHLFASQHKLLQFKNGQGIRFVTQWVSDGVWPVPMDCVYTFQGMTNDGSWWVSAEFAVKRPKVDSDKLTLLSRDLNYERWRVFEKELDLPHASSFLPDLSRLDEIIESLSIMNE